MGKSVCLTCGGSLGPQRAIVAVSAVPGRYQSHGAVVLAGTKHLLCDLLESRGSADPGEILGIDDDTRGMVVWEGNIVYEKTADTSNGPGEWEIEYVGKARELTDAEWALVRDGVEDLAEDVNEDVNDDRTSPSAAVFGGGRDG